MRIYETIYICSPDLDEETLEDFSDTIHETIYEAGGKIIKQERWGKRRLAFEIKRKREGIYYYILYGSDGGTKEELERRLKLAEPCIRYLTVRVDDEVRGKKHKIYTKEELRLALQMEPRERKKPKETRSPRKKKSEKETPEEVKTVETAADEEQKEETISDKPQEPAPAAEAAGEPAAESDAEESSDAPEGSEPEAKPSDNKEEEK